jgi:hypothetical protein
MDSGGLPTAYLALLRASLEGREVRDGLHVAVIAFERGLADDECAAVERRFGFHFPPDLRRLLQYALPVGGGADWQGRPNPRTGFPDWRSWPDELLRRRLEAPVEGICFDVEHNDFWAPAWGPRPVRAADACATAREQLARLPRLIPVYGHRYLPGEPTAAGNPVFSVVQTDVLRYGSDLPRYFEREFDVPAPAGPAPDGRQIAFWDDLAGGLLDRGAT